MRSINRIGIIWLFIGFPIFATGYQEVRTSNLVYCPDKLDCMASGNIYTNDISKSSCNIEDDKLPYVARIEHHGPRGTYDFQVAYASYNPAHHPIVAEVLCIYRLQNAYLGITYKAIANLEIDYLASTKWDVSGNRINYMQNATCKASSATQCPLHSRPEVIIDSRAPNDQFLSVKVSANGIAINETFITSHLNQYLRINNEEAYVTCGGATQCKLDIYYKKNKVSKKGQNIYYAGNIVVDMLDNMKIIQVNTGPSNGSTGQYLLKRSPFNAVQFVN